MRIKNLFRGDVFGAQEGLQTFHISVSGYQVTFEQNVLFGPFGAVLVNVDVRESGDVKLLFLAGTRERLTNTANVRNVTKVYERSKGGLEPRGVFRFYNHFFRICGFLARSLLNAPVEQAPPLYYTLLRDEEFQTMNDWNPGESRQPEAEPQGSRAVRRQPVDAENRTRRKRKTRLGVGDTARARSARRCATPFSLSPISHRFFVPLGTEINSRNSI